MSTDKKFKILVIEDNMQMSEMVSDYLTGKFPDSVISTFKTGEQALAETKTAPDVVILDYYLDIENQKALNGLQILMKIKQLYSNTPVVFLTGQEKPEISANIIKYGAYDYVVKNQQSFVKLEAIINKIRATPVKKSTNSKNLIIAIIIILLLALVGMFLMK